MLQVASGTFRILAGESIRVNVYVYVALSADATSHSFSIRLQAQQHLVLFFLGVFASHCILHSSYHVGSCLGAQAICYRMQHRLSSDEILVGELARS